MKKIEILECFSAENREEILRYWNARNNLEEIHIRVDKPIILKFDSYEVVCECYTTQEEILNIMQHICNNSIYAYQNQICEGFITVKGGHRIGITGSAVIADGKITNIKYISSLNFRLSRQVIGCSRDILPEILNYSDNTIYNTLIISNPGAGKTTLLKDCIREISNGTENFHGINVSVVDERGELAAIYRGIPQNDLGIRTDIMDNIHKSDGMILMIRSMSPKVIAADEIGSKKDIDAINYAICSGVKGIFTMHGNDINDLKLNPFINELMQKHIFERLIFLDEKQKGKIKYIYYLNRENNEYERREK